MPSLAKKRALRFLLASMILVSACSPISAASPVPSTYVVEPGDTLWGLAKKFGITVDQITSLNNLADADAIKPGAKLVLAKPSVQSTSQKPTAAITPSQTAKPAATVSKQKPSSYTVRSGDTLWGISRATGVAVAELLSINGLREDSILRPGSTLRLSAEVEKAPAVASKQSTSTPGSKPSTAVARETTAAQPPTTAKAAPARQEVPVPVLPLPQPQLVTPIGGVVVQLPIRSGVDTPTEQSASSAKNPDKANRVDSQWATNLRQNTGITESDIDPDTAAQGSEKFVPQATDKTGSSVVPLAVANDAERAREALGRLKGGLSTGLAWPVTGRVSSQYGRRWGRMHEGVDIAVPTGTPVRAVADGVVTFAGWSGGYGNLVVVNHGEGYETYYGHNSELRVKVGASVLRGDVIARSGSTGNSTGPHVHLEVRQEGAPVDPMRYLK